MIGFSSVPNFDVHLPGGDNVTSSLSLQMTIQDSWGCMAQVNLSTVVVRAETMMINDVIDHIQTHPQSLNNHSLIRLLSSGNQNIVSQVLNSFSSELNRMTDDNQQQAVSSN